MRRCRAYVMLGVLLLVNVSCDEAPTAPQAIIDAANQPTTQPDISRPTTEELLGGEYRKLILPDMPLSLRAPQSWKFNVAGNLRLLEGPSPSGDAIIQLSNRQPIRDELVEGVVNKLKAEIDTTRPISKAELRQAGAMRILERLSVDPPHTEPKLDSLGNPVFDARNQPVLNTTTRVRWTIIALIPEGKLWNQYELNVLSLTTDNFDADRRLFEKVLGSLMHEPGLSPPAN